MGTEFRVGAAARTPAGDKSAAASPADAIRRVRPPPLLWVQLRAGGAPSGGFPSESLPQTPSLPTPQNPEKQNLHTFHTKTLFFRANGYITSAPRVGAPLPPPAFLGGPFSRERPKMASKIDLYF